MLSRVSSFDVAPPRSPLSRGAPLLLLGAAALGWSGWRYHEAATELERVRAAAGEVRAAQLRKEDTSKQQALARQSPEELQRTQALRQVQRLASNAWFDLLAALEGAAHEVQSGVSVVSLTPSRSAGHGTDIRIVALAASEELMLEYLRLLRVDGHVALAELVSHEPQPQAEGKPLLRFQLNVRWIDEAGAPVGRSLPAGVASVGSPVGASPSTPAGTPAGKWE